MVWKLHRFSRSLEETIEYRDRLRQTRTKLLSATERAVDDLTGLPTHNLANANRSETNQPRWLAIYPSRSWRGGWKFRFHKLWQKSRL